MPYVRFPVPEFRYEQFKDREWSPPSCLAPAEIERLMAAHTAGDAAVYGCYPIMPEDAFFERLAVRGEHRHAILCLLPDNNVRLVGRSHAWFINRALLTDSLDPQSLRMVADWKTPRPMNTRLGPDDGVAVAGVLYAVCCHRYGDHWLGNRTLVDNDWDDAEGTRGCRILSSSEEEINDFHHANLTFEWIA